MQLAILRPKEVRELAPAERLERLQQLRTELSRENGAIASGTRPENPGRIRELRRTIARILTIQGKVPFPAVKKVAVKKKAEPKKEVKKKAPAKDKPPKKKVAKKEKEVGSKK